MVKKYKVISIVLILAVFLTITGDVNKEDMQLKYSIKYIGHRGLGGLAPENTLPAFELAGKLGFWGAECDVRTTSDGNWMILHDSTVDRMTNGTGQIKNLTLKKIQSLNIDSGINISEYKGLKVLKLEDYLSVSKKWRLTPVIEMKSTDNLQYYGKFIETIKKYGSIEKTVVISVSPVILNELRKLDKYVILGLICSDVTQKNIDYVKALKNAFIECYYPKITKNKVDLCHENNIKLGAWTVDDKYKANNLINYGVDYLTTNSLVPDKSIRQ